MQSTRGRTLLFDIDGTLADTDAVHLEAFNRVFAPHGQSFARPRYAQEIQGFSNQSISARSCRMSRRTGSKRSWTTRKPRSARW